MLPTILVICFVQTPFSTESYSIYICGIPLKCMKNRTALGSILSAVFCGLRGNMDKEEITNVVVFISFSVCVGGHFENFILTPRRMRFGNFYGISRSEQ